MSASESTDHSCYRLYSQDMQTVIYAAPHFAARKLSHDVGVRDSALEVHEFHRQIVMSVYESSHLCLSFPSQ